MPKKSYIVSVVRKGELGEYTGSIFTILAFTLESAINNFWSLEGDGVYEDDDFDGFVMVYDMELGKTVYRYGCGY